MQALNQNLLMADITPLPVILGMIFFVACCLFLMERFLNDYATITKFTLCAAFVLNPFFISNMSYKYDSFPMYIALGLSIVSVFIRGKKSSVFWEFPISIILISILCLYQAALSLIISLMALDLCISAIKNNINFRHQIYRAVTVIFSYIIYSKIIAPHYLRFIYVDMSKHIPLNHEGIILLKNNIKTSLNLLSHFYHGRLMHVCIISYTIIYILGIIFIICKRQTGSQTNLWVRLGAYICGTGVIALCALSLTIFLQNPDIQPRVLLGTFGFILSAPLILVSMSRAPVPQCFAMLLCIMQIIPTLGISFSFGNYLKQKQAHDSDAVKEIEFHLAHYTTNAQTKITFLNDNPSTPSMNVKKAVHPLIADFAITQGLGRNYDWYSRGFLKINNIYYDLDNSYQPTSKFVPTVKTCHVLTYFSDNRIFVLFQPQC